MISILLLLLFYFIFLFYILRDFFIDIKIYDKTDNPNIITGYNIGDLLNMPYYFNGWSNNPSKIYDDSIKIYKDTILYYYSTLRTDKNEPIPNLGKIILATDIYR